MLEIEHTKIVSPFSIGKKRQIRRNHQGNEKIGIFSENGGNMENIILYLVIGNICLNVIFIWFLMSAANSIDSMNEWLHKNEWKI